MVSEVGFEPTPAYLEGYINTLDWLLNILISDS